MAPSYVRTKVARVWAIPVRGLTATSIALKAAMRMPTGAPAMIQMGRRVYRSTFAKRGSVKESAVMAVRRLKAAKDQALVVPPGQGRTAA